MNLLIFSLRLRILPLKPNHAMTMLPFKNQLMASAFVAAGLVLSTAPSLAQNDLTLQGVIDFTVPSGGSDGKALHLTAVNDIPDLSIYGGGTANNGGGTDGQEYTFPAISVAAGESVFVVRSVAAMESYFSVCYSAFDHVIENGSWPDQNGDDAIELFMNGEVIETFGEIDVDGTGQPWEYLDSWAYKLDGEWTYGGINCTDNTLTIFDSSCPYPFCEVPEVIPGCTDPTAFNYNPGATEDDGSCVPVIEGCMVEAADNYDMSANTACVDCCEFGGCMDETALNYDSGANVDDGSCIYDNSSLTNALALQGVIDFTVPEGGSSGKGLHFVAVDDIADLSLFGGGTANNGGGTDGQEYTFPALAVAAGESVFVVRDAAAMEAYLGSCFGAFDHVIEDGSWPDQNGDDAIELFENGVVIETFGDIDVDGSGEPWEYTDSWAFKVAGEWTYGVPNCTDNTPTIFDADCLYPVCGDFLGCTDPFYMEFDPYAPGDDGSCMTLKVWGCTYDAASNFDPAANIDDGSCVVETGVACPGDLDGDGTVATPDLLSFLSVFGTDCN